MLVLARKVHEEITIGDDIVITVVEVKNKVVKLGVTAPIEKLIFRREAAIAYGEVNEGY